jgi:hypothetical protein
MYIRHVTLTTGHARDSLQSEVSAHAVAVCRALIERVVDGDVSEAIPIPGAPGYSIAGRRAGKCMVATVYADGPPSVLICTIGVAAHSRCGSRLWREMHRWGTTPVATSPDRCPHEPWCAAALDEGAVTHPDAMTWLGDFERCLAWAWVGVGRS